MSERMITALVIAVTIGSGMMAGVFLAFSSFIMAALGRLPPSAGMAAMQNINVTVINPLFMTGLFGTALLCFVLDIIIWRNGTIQQGSLLYLASALYIGGAILVTMGFNVPLNDALAGVSSDSETGTNLWSRYLVDWTFWNSVRGLASCAACAVFALALSSP